MNVFHRDPVLTQREQSEKETREALERINSKLVEESIRAELNKEKEKQLWDKFLEITKDQHYFRLSHVDGLGCPYNVLLFLSNKNTGKTTEIYRMLGR